MAGCRLITDKIKGEIDHYMKLQSFSLSLYFSKNVVLVRIVK